MKKSDRPRPTYALLLRNNNRDIRHGDGYGFMEISIVTIAEGKVRNPSCDTPYADLQFSAQWDQPSLTDRSRADYTYGWRLAYRDIYQVALHDAERMIKVLRKAEHAYMHAKVKPLTFGQYVTTVCLALGIENVMRETKTSPNVLTYADRDFNN